MRHFSIGSLVFVLSALAVQGCRSRGTISSQLNEDIEPVYTDEIILSSNKGRQLTSDTKVLTPDQITEIIAFQRQRGRSWSEKDFNLAFKHNTKPDVYIVREDGKLVALLLTQEVDSDINVSVNGRQQKFKAYVMNDWGISPYAKDPDQVIMLLRNRIEAMSDRRDIPFIARFRYAWVRHQELLMRLGFEFPPDVDSIGLSKADDPNTGRTNFKAQGAMIRNLDLTNAVPYLKIFNSSYNSLVAFKENDIEDKTPDRTAVLITTFPSLTSSLREDASFWNYHGMLQSEVRDQLFEFVTSNNKTSVTNGAPGILVVGAPGEGKSVGVRQFAKEIANFEKLGNHEQGLIKEAFDGAPEIIELNALLLVVDKEYRGEAEKVILSLTDSAAKRNVILIIDEGRELERLQPQFWGQLKNAMSQMHVRPIVVMTEDEYTGGSIILTDGPVGDRFKVIRLQRVEDSAIIQDLQKLFIEKSLNLTPTDPRKLLYSGNPEELAKALFYISSRGNPNQGRRRGPEAAFSSLHAKIRNRHPEGVDIGSAQQLLRQIYGFKPDTLLAIPGTDPKIPSRIKLIKGIEDPRFSQNLERFMINAVREDSVRKNLLFLGSDVAGEAERRSKEIAEISGKIHAKFDLQLIDDKAALTREIHKIIAQTFNGGSHAILHFEGFDQASAEKRNLLLAIAAEKKIEVVFNGEVSQAFKIPYVQFTVATANPKVDSQGFVVLDAPKRSADAPTIIANDYITTALKEPIFAGKFPAELSEAQKQFIEEYVRNAFKDTDINRVPTFAFQDAVFDALYFIAKRSGIMDDCEYFHGRVQKLLDFEGNQIESKKP